MQVVRDGEERGVDAAADRAPASSVAAAAPADRAPRPPAASAGTASWQSDDLGVRRRRDRAGVGQPMSPQPITAKRSGRARRRSGGAHGARRPRAAGGAGRRRRGAERARARGTRVQSRCAASSLAAREAPVEEPDLARVDRLAGEVGRVEPPGGERREERAREPGERVAVAGRRASVASALTWAPTRRRPLALELAERGVLRDAARRAEQDDRAAGAGRRDGRRERGRVAGRLDRPRRPRSLRALLDGQEARAPAPQRGRLAAAAGATTVTGPAARASPAAARARRSGPAPMHADAARPRSAPRGARRSRR